MVRRWYLNAAGYPVSGPDSLHRFIVGAVPGQYVDHIDRDILNATRGNLRIATATENAANRSVNRTDKTSQYRGVSLNRSGKWVAMISVGGRPKYLGSFTSEEDAARAYDKAALARWGEFAQVNFP